MKLFKKKEKVIPKLSYEEKAFLLAWAGLYKLPKDMVVEKRDGDTVVLGDIHSWFTLPGKFKGFKEGTAYTIEELTK